MIVAGVDPSLTSAGVAILDNGQPTLAESYGFPGHNGASYQQRSRRIRHQVWNATREILRIRDHVALVVIEEHPYAVRISGSEFDRSALWHGIYGALDHANIPIAVMPNSTAKKWITGRGNAKKPEIVATIDSWWPGVARNDDEADALGLAAIGAHHLGDPMPFTTKERHTTALANIPWPEVATP